MPFFLLFILLLLPQTSPAQTTSDSVIVSKLREEGVRFSSDNNIRLLTTGQEKFDDMFDAIRQAKHSVHLEYFNFRNDSIAFLLFDVLAERAAQGVKVRALYDAFGNMSNNQPLKKKHINNLRARGIDIHEFDPIRFPWLNHAFGRDHRKIVVIDGQIAYTGGMNVADYYLNGTPVVGEWRDMHCRLEGSAVDELQLIFVNSWLHVTGEDIYSPDLFRGKPSGDMMCGIVNREPRKTPKAVRQFYYHAISSAQDTIRIVNPYFTLIPKIRHAIEDALDRGVHVQLMLSEKCDEPVTPDVSYYNANKLMKRGCEVWIYRPGFHHTKVIMVDGRTCTVGSTNLDARSLKCDYEENVAIIDPRITQQLTDIFERDKEKSFKLTPEKYKEWRTPWQRFRSWLYNLLTPLL